MNKEEQIRLILKDFPTISYSDIAKKIGCSKSTIQYYFHKLGIKRDRIVQQKINNTNRNHPIILTNKAKSILIGTLLGDASITKYRRNCEPVKILNSAITCGHSYMQKDYILYIKMLLEEEGLKIHYSENPKPYNHIIQGKECICNGRCDIKVSRNIAFNIWRDMWYPDNKKRLPKSLIINYLTPLSLAIWFMDDGTKNNCSYYLHTEGFTIEEVNFLQSILLNRFTIETSIHMSKDKPIIYIRAESRKSFTNIIKPYICKSMKYKLIE